MVCFKLNFVTRIRCENDHTAEVAELTRHDMGVSLLLELLLSDEPDADSFTNNSPPKAQRPAPLPTSRPTTRRTTTKKWTTTKRTTTTKKTTTKRTTTTTRQPIADLGGFAGIGEEVPSEEEQQQDYDDYDAVF